MNVKGVFLFFACLCVLCLAEQKAFSQENKALSKDKTESEKNKAMALFEKGLKFLEEGKFEPALIEFEEAYKISPNPLVLFNIATCLKESSSYVEASKAFKKFLADAGESAKEDLIEEATKAVSELETYIGYLSIECDPPGGEVFVDGSPAGILPLDQPVALDIGKHNVTIMKENYEIFKRTTGIRSGAQETLKALLVKITNYGKLTVKANVQDALIKIDGKKKGGPEWSGNIPEGTHDIMISAGGHRDFSCSIDVERDEEKLVEAFMLHDPVPSRLNVKINIQKASLLLDGEKKMTPPGVLWGIAPGEHSLLISKKGYKAVESMIDMGSGQDILLSAELYPGKVAPGWFWAALAVTIGSLGGALVAFLIERDAYNDLNRGYPSDKEQDALKQRGADAEGAAIGLLVGGGVMAAATIILAFFVDFKAKKSSIKLQISNLPIKESEDCQEQNKENIQLQGDPQ